MATTRRQDILDNLQTVIDALSSINTAEVDSKRSLSSITADKMPFVNINQAGATYDPENSGIGSLEMWQLNVELSIYTTAGNAEIIRGEIKEAINVDITRGGYAKNTIYVEDTGIINLEVPNATQQITMLIAILYTTEGGKQR